MSDTFKDEINSGGPPRVLVADDNRMIRELTKSQLLTCGAQVSLAANGLEALELMKAQAFDVALLDLRMPLLGGLDIVKLMLTCPSDYPKRPLFVVISASDDEEQIQKCFLAGIDDYLCKPVSRGQLREGLARWCAAATSNLSHPLSSKKVLSNIICNYRTTRA